MIEYIYSLSPQGVCVLNILEAFLYAGHRCVGYQLPQ